MTSSFKGRLKAEPTILSLENFKVTMHIFSSPPTNKLNEMHSLSVGLAPAGNVSLCEQTFDRHTCRTDVTEAFHGFQYSFVLPLISP